MPLEPGASADLECAGDRAAPAQAGGNSSGPSVLGQVEYGLPAVSLTPLTWLPAAGPTRDAESRNWARARESAAAGDNLYCQGRFASALERYREAARLRPAEPEYHYKIGCAAWKGDRAEEAEGSFLEAIRLDPRHAAAHDALGQWYLEASRFDLALQHSAIALELKPDDPDFILSRAFVLAEDGQSAGAWELIAPLVAAGSTDPRLAGFYARLAPRIGHESEAAAALDRAMSIPGRSAVALPHLHFAAAALLDRMGRYDEAFEHARLANESSRRPHDPAAHAEQTSHRIGYFSPQRLRSLPRATHSSRRPVFIIGMPRSGTSLVEQILASHPQVFGAGELMDLTRIARSASEADWSDGSPYPEYMDALSLRKANRLASSYLSTVRALASGATYVTDKMPLNFLYLGMVQVLFPECHVIHCVRDPLDTCLSCYMTDFAGGNAFSSDLLHLGAYYRDYVRLMDHWRSVLSLPILDVRYEDVVADLEGQARRMLQFLDLPWDERCLKFHENRRQTNTASKDQVRRPIYASSVGRWKHYEKHLGPLIEALG